MCGVCDGVAVRGKGLEFGGVFVFEVGVTMIGI